MTRRAYSQTIWERIIGCIISLGGCMVMKKTAGKHLKGDIHAGRIVGMDNVKSSAPENLVLPKATKAPKAPQARSEPVTLIIRVEPASKKE
jgi:hypothetical protein